MQADAKIDAAIRALSFVQSALNEQRQPFTPEDVRVLLQDVKAELRITSAHDCQGTLEDAIFRACVSALYSV
jgi:hypothetical protein